MADQEQRLVVPLRLGALRPADTVGWLCAPGDRPPRPVPRASERRGFRDAQRGPGREMVPEPAGAGPSVGSVAADGGKRTCSQPFGKPCARRGRRLDRPVKRQRRTGIAAISASAWARTSATVTRVDAFGHLGGSAMTQMASDRAMRSAWPAGLSQPHQQAGLQPGGRGLISASDMSSAARLISSMVRLCQIGDLFARGAA